MVKRALLVHNNKFTDKSFHPLYATGNDVARLISLLQQDYVGFAPENIEELENPNLSDFRAAVSRFFRNADRDDYLFFYYAGHGIRSETGELHLALKRTTMEDYEALSLNAGFIRRNLERSISEKKVVVLDCCNAGAFREGGRFIARDATYDPGLLSANFDPQGTGTYVLGASQSGSSAYETKGEDGKPYSLFTDVFIHGVETGEAAPGNEKINLVDVGKYIFSRRNRSGKATRPFIDVENAAGLLEFARNPNPVGSGDHRPPDPPPPPFTQKSRNFRFRKRAPAIGIAVVVLIGGAFFLWAQYPGSGSSTPYKGAPSDPSRVGLTWRSFGKVPGVPDVVSLGCYSKFNNDKPCPQILGWTECSKKLPLLCISHVKEGDDPTSERVSWPGGGTPSPDWINRRAELTLPIIPPRKRSDADRVCQDQFGATFRVATITESQNPSAQGWRFDVAGDILPDEGPFWIDVRQKYQDELCWTE
ncbi:MAG: caspase family protein [Alphaproteobacteria bacterium]|nr:caspase family protein [Alphaproteobacteria bacterium]